ncbi:MAG: hypothetical protein HZB50_00090 [Chloroflexi bacterium]|nr:hypothetical protein [Chloroflexota bacterium]
MKGNLFLVFVIIATTTLACGLSAPALPTATETPIPATATEVPPTATFTPIPTLTPIPTATPIPGTVVLDFIAQLCNAKWMNGGQKFASCPDANADHSKGYAIAIDPTSEGLPAGTPVLMTIPAWNGFAALFLRYPALTIQAGDRFRATIQCQSTSTACDVSFGLDYYDANGKYHSPLGMWNQNTGMTPTVIDFDLSSLAGQNVDLVLAIRPNNSSPQFDAGLWIAPQVFRPGK